jgi:hypothetical protein
MESSTEYWRAAPSRPTLEVSSEGRVRNSLTGRVLRSNSNRFGYPRIGVQSPRKATRIRVLAGRMTAREMLRRCRAGLRLVEKLGADVRRAVRS